MNQQEQARIQVLNRVLEYRLPIAQAAEIMGASEHHTKRLLAAYRKHGAAAMVKLASNGYAGANHCYFTELLRERESNDLNRPTVRRILVRAGIASPRSRCSQQHRFRAPSHSPSREGTLVQVGGGELPWLEDRGPKLTLLIIGDVIGGQQHNDSILPSGRKAPDSSP